MAKYGSGSKKVTPNSGLRTSRYQYLSLEDAEPNLGFTTEKVLPLKENYYQLVSFDGGTVYDRYWQVAPAGIITGISIFDEGFIVGTGNSINKLDFRGNIITATANNFGTISTITVAPPGDDTQLIYNSGGNFAASGNLTFNSSNTLSVIGLGSFSAGSLNQKVKVGISSNNIIDTTSGDLILDANSGITSIKSVLVAGISTFIGSNQSNLITLSQTGSGNALFANGTVISGLGSIGVGTTIPTQDLDVNGDIRLRGTIYDFNNNPGSATQILIKNFLGGLEWVSQSTLVTGAGGTFTNIQFQNNAGLLDGANNFVYDPVTSRVGLGSTLPNYLLDVLGYSRFTGQVEVNNLNVTGVATIASLKVSGLSTTKDFIVTGVSTITTLGVTGLTTSRNLIISGVSTLSSLGVSGLTTTRDFRAVGVSTLGITTITNLTSQQVIVSGIATLGRIEVNSNKVSSTTGNIIIDSTGGTTQVNDIVFVNDSTPSTTITDGALVVNGGVGIKSDVNIGGSLSVNGNSQINGTSTFLSLASFSSGLTVNAGTLTVLTATDSISKDTGAVIIDGGVGIEKNLYVGSLLSVAGIASFSDNILPTTNASKDIGSITRKWNKIYATDVTATTFNGAFYGNADTATYALNAGISTNIKGGLAGQIPYQSAPDRTSFTASGTLNFLLKSTGTGAPSWVDPTTLLVAYAVNAGIATNIKGGAGGSIPYQTADSKTDLLSNGFAGQLLQSNGGTLAPSWVNAALLSVSYANNSGISTNLKGGLAGQIPYQSAPDRTSFTATGTVDYLLKSTGTGAPSWVDPTTLSVAYAVNAGISTNIKGGVAYQIPCQIGPSSTSFISNGTATGQILQYNENALPTWTSPTELTVKNAVYAANSGVATYASISGISTYAINAGIATNIKGGAGGQLLYQSSEDNTAKLANGALGSILRSGGGTAAPSWVDQANLTVGKASYADNAGIATNLKGGDTYQIPYQTVANRTDFIARGTATGQLLQYNLSAAPSWVDPTNLTVQFATYSTESGIATNIKGGVGGQLLYQSSANNTAKLVNGALGTILRSGGGTAAPSWVDPTNLTVGKASYADNAGISTHLKGGDTYQIPYQTVADRTGFISNGSQGQLLQYNTSAAPSWVSVNDLTAGKALYADSAGLSTHIRGGAGGALVYQTETSRTNFIANGSSGTILRASGGSTAPSWVDPTNLTVGKALYADNAGVSTHLKGGDTYQIPYQTEANKTSFIAKGTATGQLLQYNLSAAPSWVSVNNLTAGKALYADNAGISTHISGGDTYQIPYQTAANRTDFISNGTATGQLLQYNLNAAPSWVNPTNLIAGKASYADNAGVSTHLKGGDTYQIPYQTEANKTSFIANGTTTGQLLQYNVGAAPSWVNPTTLLVAYAVNAGIATNIRGGVAFQIPYQTAANRTDFIPNGTTTGQLLQYNVGAAPSWVSVNNLTAGKASYADNAGISTHLKGGDTYQIPYQTAANRTDFIANGTTTGQLLQYNVGAAPSWVSVNNLTAGKALYADNAGIATNIRGGVAFQIPYQTAANRTDFIPNGTATGQLLQYNLNAAPSWVSLDNLTTTKSVYADNAGIATNLKGGVAFQIPYQTAANRTDFIPNGTTTGQLLQYNVGAAPSWVSVTNLTAGKASYADNAGIATNLKGGVAFQIPYQTAANRTDFIPNGTTTGQLLQYNVGAAPSWVSVSNITAGKSAYSDNAGIATNLKGGRTYSIPYQSSADKTEMLPIGRANQVLRSNGTTSPPSWEDTSSFAAGSSNYAKIAGIATNISGGRGGDLLYQSSVDRTAKLTIGQADWILVSNGTTPEWRNPTTSITVQNASNATTAGTANDLAGGSAGSIPYQNQNGSTQFVSPGQTGQLLQSGGSGAPTWTNPSNLTVSNATTAGTANDLAGGSAGSIPYQSGANSTEYVPPGADGQVLQSTGNGRPTWVDLPAAIKAAVSFNNNNSDQYLVFTSGSGEQILNIDSSLLYNPGTNLISGQAVRINFLGVGVVPGSTSGEIRASGNIIAYYSDERLKENINIIDNALSKVLSLKGVTFNSNSVAEKYGYIDKKEQVGVIAQDVEKVLPQIVIPAPFDIGKDSNGNEYSISGENYKTVQYDKLVPLLIEAIKEQQEIIKKITKKIGGI